MPSRRNTIADDLRHRIATGHLKPGERLPSEAQLAAAYEVSTPTLRAALALLQGEGLIEKVHGNGNFVRTAFRRLTYAGGRLLDPQTTTTATLRVTVRTTNLRAHGHLTALLQVPPRSPLTEYLCVSHDGKSPHSLSRIYVPRDLAPADLPGGPTSPDAVAARLAELRSPPTCIEEKLSARLPTPQEAATLRISATLAVLSITRVATDNSSRVVEAAFLTLPSDRADALFTTHPTDRSRSPQG